MPASFRTTFVPVVQYAFLCDGQEAGILRLQGMPCTHDAPWQRDGQGMPCNWVKVAFSPIIAQ